MGARPMLNKLGIALGAAVALACCHAAAAADGHRKHVHHPRRLAAGPTGPAVSPPVVVGRLVHHPANNIACDTRDRPLRAIPCDQPVWVYGSPCEIDQGEGFYRECGQPPGVGLHDRWRNGRP